MADFFDDQKDINAQIEESLNITEEGDTAEDQEEVVEEISKVKVGEEEYTQDELDRLVSLGKIGVEAEEKYNTKIDSVWPEYSKSRNEVKELREQVEALKQGNMAPISEGRTDDETSQAIEAAKKLGLMTADQFATFYQEQRASERILEKVEGLESEIDGKDGRPRFNKIEVLEFMRDNGITNPELAYKIKYEDQLDSWKEKKLSGAKKENIVTTQKSGSTSKSPEEVKPNRDNLYDLVRESLGQ